MNRKHYSEKKDWVISIAAQLLPNASAVVEASETDSNPHNHILLSKHFLLFITENLKVCETGTGNKTSGHSFAHRHLKQNGRCGCSRRSGDETKAEEDGSDARC
jgi:hypothetical protein